MTTSLVAIIALAASAAVSDLRTLYDQHRWADLRAAAESSDASPFYRGAVDAAFNDSANAERNLRAAIDAPPEWEGQGYEAREMLIGVYMRAGRYRDVLALMDQGLLERPDAEDLKNARALYSALAQYPEQSVEAHAFARTSYRTVDGNMFVPLKVNGHRADFLVDTGANFSMISESEARRLGMKISDVVGATIGDASGTEMSFRIAMADRLIMGRTQLRNVLFFVVGDELQPFVSLPKGERGVLGFPVLFPLQRIHWDDKGQFEIGRPIRHEEPDLPNLYLEGLKVFVEARFTQGRLGMFIDTGAQGTRLLPRFAADYPQFVQKNGVKGTDRATGAMGSVEVSAMKLPEFEIRVRNQEVTTHGMSVQLETTTAGLDETHGVLGMDVMSYVGSVTLDFVTMSCAFGP